MSEYIKRKFEGQDDFGNACMFVEIEFDKPVLRNGAKHCKHFNIAYQIEEELEKILKEFTFEEVFVEPVEDEILENVDDEILENVDEIVDNNE